VPPPGAAAAQGSPEEEAEEEEAAAAPEVEAEEGAEAAGGGEGEQEEKRKKKKKKKRKAAAAAGEGALSRRVRCLPAPRYRWRPRRAAALVARPLGGGSSPGRCGKDRVPLGFRPGAGYSILPLFLLWL